MSKRLPLSLQDFRTIIEGGYKYVDKTAYIQQIAKDQGAYFLSRPRRFGKSITIASFHELFKGNNDVFKGLAIEQRWDWNQSYPVLRISFTDLDYLTLGLERALAERMEDLARLHNIELRKSTAKDRFLELLQNLSTQAKVVVLVDEYDAPILDYLGTQPKKAFENRDILRNFYKVIKDVDHLLRFVFITGVSKFSKVGVFSGLNNLIDLSFEPEFATILGYTQSELETNFEEELALASEHLNLDQPSLLAQIKTWYNGYRFAPHAETVYNPVSVNYFLQKKRFENFWFATGTPTFLMQLLKKEGLYDLQFPHTNLNGFNSFELENLKVIAVLYQAGYLTIAEEDEDGLYRLDYPNKEVHDSMLENLLETFAGVNAESSSALVN
jgi:Predicted AAA-ATPase